METSQVENTINITSLVEKLQENDSLKGKIGTPKGNGIEIIVGSKEHVNIVMSIFINNNVFTSSLRFEEQQLRSDPESKLHNYKQYQNIYELQQGIEKLLTEFKINDSL